MDFDHARANRACMENIFSPRTSVRDDQGATHPGGCAANLSPASMAMHTSHDHACNMGEGTDSPAQADARHRKVASDVDSTAAV